MLGRDLITSINLTLIFGVSVWIQRNEVQTNIEMYIFLIEIPQHKNVVLNVNPDWNFKITITIMVIDFSIPKQKQLQLIIDFTVCSLVKLLS